MTFGAFDPGAESGRAVPGQLAADMLDVRELCPFPNDPVRCGEELHWNILRLWHEMRRAFRAPKNPWL